MLIREDSPVESFHSSDPQLETVTLRCDSPNKNTVKPFPPLDPNHTAVPTVNTESFEKFRQSVTNAANNAVAAEKMLKSPWSHHHSDLGLNNLELNFLNDEYSDCEGATCLKKSNSVLKIASNLEINKWKTSPEFDSGPSPHSATSLNFINGDISSSDDDDAFNSSCELLHSTAKSKSVELNEFRMMFGSSPTLLNFNQVTQTSRLDAVPFQYRRGYTNLNDACLSSSTSDLQCFHSNNKKSTKSHHHHHHHGGSGGGGGVEGTGPGQELSSLLRHRNNGHLDYVRSYENLDRTKIVRMKNDKRGSLGSGGIIENNDGASSSGSNRINNYDWKYQSNFDRDRLHEEDSGDDYSYSNLGYDNAVGSIGGFPVGYESNESIFNINFDTADDNIYEINKLALFESKDTLDNSLAVPTTIPNNNNTRLLVDDDKCETEIELTPLPIGSKERDTRPKPPPKKLRCAECNKKLGVIMVMKCHCEKLFCAQHRYAEAHNCLFNFKAEGKTILARENPKVIAQKLPKI